MCEIKLRKKYFVNLTNKNCRYSSQSNLKTFKKSLRGNMSYFSSGKYKNRSFETYVDTRVSTRISVKDLSRQRKEEIPKTFV